MGNLKETLKSVCYQLFQSKATNDSISYVYQQLADNLGHVTIGLVPTLMLLSFHIPQVSDVLWVCPVAVLALWFVKELRDFNCSAIDNTMAGIFDLNTIDLIANITTALWYIGCGCALGYTSFVYGWCPITYTTILICTVVSLIQMAFELGAKYRLDKAGIPYLTRLCNFSINQAGGKLADTDIIKYKVTSFGSELLRGENQHLIISGPIGTGKDELACAIANELVLAGLKLRYIDACELYEELMHDTNKSYWPLEESSVIVLDGLPTKLCSTDSDISRFIINWNAIKDRLKAVNSIILIVNNNDIKLAPNDWFELCQSLLIEHINVTKKYEVITVNLAFKS